MVKYFPGATLQIEPYDESRTMWGDGPDLGPGSWLIEYADPSKDITVGGEGTSFIPIADDIT